MFELVNLLSIDAMVETFFVLLGGRLSCPLVANALATKEAKANVKNSVTTMIAAARNGDLWNISTYDMTTSFVDVFDNESLGSMENDIYDSVKSIYRAYLDMLSSHTVWFIN